MFDEEKVKEIMQKKYTLTATSVEKLSMGVGGDTFMVCANGEKYVFKCSAENGMNHPDQEAVLCKQLKAMDIPVSEYIAGSNHEYAFSFDNEQIGLLYRYIDGKVIPRNQAPDWFMEQSAVLLGKIHNKMSRLSDLPVGIGKGFFDYMTIERANESYRSSLKTACDQKKQNIIEDLEFRIHLTEKMPHLTFDLDKLTICNTHGDYTINQIICGDHVINGVIDWTCACQHPVVWEIARSFFYADPSCSDGSLNEKSFSNYVSAYCSETALTQYDRDNLLYLYFYQLSVCDYYAQYLGADESQKDEYLAQATFATNVLKNWDKML